MSPTAGFKGTSRSRWAATHDTPDASPSKPLPSLLDRIGPSLLDPMSIAAAPPTQLGNSDADSSGWNTSRTQTADSGWSTSSTSVRSVREHRHSRSPSQASSTQFIYEEAASIASAAGTVLSANNVDSDSEAKSRDDGWGDWKPKIAAEQEGAAAYQQRANKANSIHGSLSLPRVQTVLPPASAMPSNKPSSHSGFERDLPPHLHAPSASGEASQSQKNFNGLDSQSASLSQAPTSASPDDGWSSWKGDVKPVSGEDAFRRRQALTSGVPVQSSAIRESTITEPASVKTELVVSPSFNVTQPVAELPESLTRVTGSSKKEASPDGSEESKGGDEDPWAAWSATPQKDVGGADAFRRRQAMGLGDRTNNLPNAPPAASNASLPTSKSFPTIPPKAQTPPAAKKPVTPNKPSPKPSVNANKSSAGAQTSGAASPQNVVSQASGRGRGAYRGRGRGAVHTPLPATGANAAPKKAAPLPQKPVNPPIRPGTSPSIPKTAPSPPNKASVKPNDSVRPSAIASTSPTLPGENKAVDVTNAHSALETVSNALDKVRDRIARSQAVHEKLKLDIAIQVPEESLIDLVSGPLMNIMDTTEAEQEEVLNQLKGLTFDAAPHSAGITSSSGASSFAVGPQPASLPTSNGELSDFDTSMAGSEKATSIFAALDRTPQPYRVYTPSTEGDQAHHRAASTCSVASFHSATDNVPCLIDDEVGHSDGGSPVTPLQPLRSFHKQLPSKASSVSGHEDKRQVEDDRSAKLANALTSLGYSGTILVRLLGHLAKLPKKDKAMCLFSETFLHRKVAEALLVIAAEDEESEEEL